MIVTQSFKYFVLTMILLMSAHFCFTQQTDSIEYKFKLGVTSSKIIIHDIAIDTNTFNVQENILRLSVGYKLFDYLTAIFSYSNFEEESGRTSFANGDYTSLILKRDQANLLLNFQYSLFRNDSKFQPYILFGMIMLITENNVEYFDTIQPITLSSRTKRIEFGSWIGGGASYRFYDRFMFYLELSAGPMFLDAQTARQFSAGLIFDFKL